MALNYQSTQADLRDELERLARVRERILRRLARVDETIKAVSTAAKALDWTLKGHAPALVGGAVAPGDSGFEITATIREVLKEGNKLRAAQIRDALVSRGWSIGPYKNPLAVVHQVLKRLDVASERDAEGKTFFFDQAAVEESYRRFSQEFDERRARDEQLAAARTETRRMLRGAFHDIMRAHPKGLSAKTMYRELQKLSIDMSSYAQPISAIAALLYSDRNIRSFKAPANGVSLFKLAEGKTE